MPFVGSHGGAPVGTPPSRIFLRAIIREGGGGSGRYSLRNRFFPGKNARPNGQSLMSYLVIIIEFLSLSFQYVILANKTISEE